VEVSSVDLRVGSSSPDGAVIRVEGKLYVVHRLRDVVHHDDNNTGLMTLPCGDPFSLRKRLDSSAPTRTRICLSVRKSQIQLNI